MSGRNAKTNFPISQNPKNDDQSPNSSSSSPKSLALSEILHAKLRKCSKAPSPSLTCLRLDTENSNLGVWQKRAGPCSDSNWVMTVELQKKNGESSQEASKSSSEKNGSNFRREMDEEERVALQMIEELLNMNSPSTGFGIQDGQPSFYM